MSSDLPGSQVNPPDENPDAGKPAPDNPAAPGKPPPGSAAEEEKILDEGETVPPKNPVQPKGS